MINEMSLTQEEINELQKYFMTRRFEYTKSDLKSMAIRRKILRVTIE